MDVHGFGVIFNTTSSYLHIFLKCHLVFNKHLFLVVTEKFTKMFRAWKSDENYKKGKEYVTGLK